ncbi:intradiol ring-cleavage dioxygenase [Micropruina sp.]|uniref:intradiol ring-cleavage dioxygenase n=1 Tax=Micropruina sp. TaxID=2737536 RepID=UPI0039E69B12
MNLPPTPDGRYEGRPLTDPTEPLVDQGLQFDLGTLLSRRGILGVFGVGAVGLTLAACTTGTAASSSASATATSSTGLTEIPDETNGPYPGDGTNGPDILEQSGVVRSDITASFGDSTTVAEGIPMRLTLTILDLAGGGGAFEGVAVYVWHCNREGNYSMYSSGIENENYLRGVQIADSDGTVTFTSIFPACYSGRWPHVHFEVYPDEASITNADNRLSTSQVALPEDVCNAVFATEGYSASIANFAQVSLATDNVFGDDSGATQLATVSGDVTNGYTVTLTVPIDTSTEPTEGTTVAGGGGAPSGGGSGGPGGTPGGMPPSGAPSGVPAPSTSAG